MDIVILQYSIFANSSDVNSMDILLQNEEELSKILLQLSNDLQNSFLI